MKIVFIIPRTPLMHWEMARLLAVITAPSQLLNPRKLSVLPEKRSQAVAVPVCYTMAWTERSSSHLPCGHHTNLGHRRQKAKGRSYLLARASDGTS